MITTKEIEQSGQLITRVFQSFRPRLMEFYGTIGYVTKDDASPVTELDIEIEQAVKKELLKEFPEFGFKGEETEAIETSSGAVWYVDPIDSTSSFIHGLPYCSNMAALVIDDEIIASIIYHFATDELYIAQKGKGATKNGKRIVVKDMPLPQSFVYANSYAYKHAYQFFAPEKVGFFAPVGASGYYFTRLAEGAIQGVCYVKSSSKQHDLLPGALLAAEAGAEIIAFGKKPTDYTGERFIAGTKSLCAVAQAQRQHGLDTV